MAASVFKWSIAVIFCFFSRGAGGGEPVVGFTGGEGPAAGNGARHPLYITVTEINHNVKDRILEVSCKMFTNDFEVVLGKLAKSKVDLSAADKKATDKLIETYVMQHLRLSCDGKAAVLHFVGSEKEADGTWSYFQVNDVASVRKIDVTNNLLYDGFNQEINIMHVTVGGVRKSTRLDYPDANASFQF